MFDIICFLKFHGKCTTQFLSLISFFLQSNRNIEEVEHAPAGACGSTRGFLAFMANPGVLYSKAGFIAENLYKFCFIPDGGKRIRETGSIAPGLTLKSKRTRAAFQWAAGVKHKSRFFTLAALRSGVKRLTKMEGVIIPTVGVPFDFWVECQAKSLKHLCARARKNSGSTMRFAAYHQSSFGMTDWQETLPMVDPLEDDNWLCQGLGKTFAIKSYCFLESVDCAPTNLSEFNAQVG